MNRRIIAKIYAYAGTIITTWFGIALNIQGFDPLWPVQWIGWAFVGLAIGVITLFVAAELCRKKLKLLFLIGM